MINVRPLRASNGVSVTQMAATYLQLQTLHQAITSIHLPFKLLLFLLLHYFLCFNYFKSSYKHAIVIPTFILIWYMYVNKDIMSNPWSLEAVALIKFAHGNVKQITKIYCRCCNVYKHLLDEIFSVINLNCWSSSSDP